MQINKGILEKRSYYQIAKFAVSKRNIIGIKETFLNNNIFKIFPNPFNNEAKIILQNTSVKSNLLLKIYDLTGRQLTEIENISEQNNTINKNGLSSGMYMFRVLSNKDFIGSGKFIVQ
jgi:hypothetical protein